MIKREVLNRLLLMRLIQLSDGITGKTRLQKLVFEIEARTRKLGSTDTFNYRFIRWHYGPYAKEITEDMAFLIKQGLVREENNNYHITSRGQQFIKNTWNIVSEFFNGENIMHGTIRELRNKNLNLLLRQVYETHDVKHYKMGEVIEDLKYVGV
jgi:uncharacterized protein